MKDLSLHLMDIAQNAIEAGATLIRIALFCQNDRLLFTVADNGKGMEPELMVRVADPFVTTRSTRKVGLGIPLLKLSAEMAGGSFNIKSQKGEGTEISADFKKTHIDRIPVGDMDDTMKALILAYPELDFELRFKAEQNKYEIKTQDVKKVLGNVPINNTDILDWIGENIRAGLNEVFGGVLNEISR